MIELITPTGRKEMKVMVDTSMSVKVGSIVIWKYCKNGYTVPFVTGQYHIDTRQDKSVLKPVIAIFK